ncbi:MAG: peptidyl-prolyl cis-trans isomerase [Gammaproteobacteria bacterium]|nr:peptidyl-prolyl cis-trans isomerase [Gammaproteobacteria bacterium]
MKSRHPSVFALLSLLLGILVPISASATGPEKPIPGNPKVLIETSEGNITLELEPSKAPLTVENFLQYVRDGQYDGTIFHRVIKDFMIQGGGYDNRFSQRPTRPPIENEAANALSNKRGTISMARTSNPHSATAQFFINTVDNPHLDFRAPTPVSWGYAAFGRVVEGMDVVDRIDNLPTGSGGPFRRDVPNPVVEIKHVSILPQ